MLVLIFTLAGSFAGFLGGIWLGKRLKPKPTPTRSEQLAARYRAIQNNPEAKAALDRRTEELKAGEAFLDFQPTEFHILIKKPTL